MKKIKYLSLLSLLILTSCSGFTYESEGYQKRTEEVTYFDEAITSIDLGWVNGKVTFEKLYGDDQRLSFYESDTKYPLYYKVKDNELSIRYVKSGTSEKAVNGLTKDLTILVPDKLVNFVIDTVETDVVFDDFIDPETMKVNGVNSVYTFGSYMAKETEFNFVNCSFTCSTFDCHLKSKMGEPITHKVKMDFIASSATLKITPNEGIGYQVKTSGIDNTFVSTVNNNELKYGEGFIDIDFKGINSQLTINRWDE